MTDLEKLQALLKEFGLTEDENPTSGSYPPVANGKDFKVCENLDNLQVPKATILTLGQGKGYSDFHVNFIFDQDGKFVEHGVWE